MAAIGWPPSLEWGQGVRYRGGGTEGEPLPVGSVTSMLWAPGLRPRRRRRSI